MREKTRTTISWKVILTWPVVGDRPKEKLFREIMPKMRKIKEKTRATSLSLSVANRIRNMVKMDSRIPVNMEYCLAVALFGRGVG